MASGLHERLPKFYLRKLREWKNKKICKKNCPHCLFQASSWLIAEEKRV